MPHLNSGAQQLSASPSYVADDIYRECLMRLPPDAFASLPEPQFQHRIEVERELIVAERARFGWRPLRRREIMEAARRNAKNGWIEQGIWNEAWPKSTVWRWPHEEASSSQGGPGSFAIDFADASKVLAFQGAQDTNMVDTEMSNGVDRSALSYPDWMPVPDRQASRPFYQFLYQASQAHRLISEREDISGVQSIEAIRQQGYGQVRAEWKVRGIWDDSWAEFPEMSWKHETAIADLSKGALVTSYDADNEPSFVLLPQTPSSDQSQEGLFGTSDDGAPAPARWTGDYGTSFGSVQRRLWGTQGQDSSSLADSAPVPEPRTFPETAVSGRKRVFEEVDHGEVEGTGHGEHPAGPSTAGGSSRDVKRQRLHEQSCGEEHC